MSNFPLIVSKCCSSRLFRKYVPNRCVIDWLVVCVHVYERARARLIIRRPRLFSRSNRGRRDTKMTTRPYMMFGYRSRVYVREGVASMCRKTYTVVWHNYMDSYTELFSHHAICAVPYKQTEDALLAVAANTPLRLTLQLPL